jgi:hypothetical protein
MRSDIVAGAVFPDYELTDHTGERRKLSDLQGPDPLILVLSRGGFCPRPAPGRGSGPPLPRDGSRLLPPRHHQYRQQVCCAECHHLPFLPVHHVQVKSDTLSMAICSSCWLSRGWTVLQMKH